MAIATKAAKPRAKASRARFKRTTAKARQAFLEVLALTANVTAAAKKAKFTTSAIYHHRRGDPEFRSAWHAALCEGYARLETELLAEALAEPDTEASDAVVKARLYKQRLALALLAAHRASVRGERSVAPVVIADDCKGAKARLVEKIETMRQRLADKPPEPAIGLAE